MFLKPENKGNDAQDSVLVGCRGSQDTVGRDADCLEFEDSVESAVVVVVLREIAALADVVVVIALAVELAAAVEFVFEELDSELAQSLVVFSAAHQFFLNQLLIPASAKLNFLDPDK